MCITCSCFSATQIKMSLSLNGSACRRRTHRISFVGSTSKVPDLLQLRIHAKRHDIFSSHQSSSPHAHRGSSECMEDPASAIRRTFCHRSNNPPPHFNSGVVERKMAEMADPPTRCARADWRGPATKEAMSAKSLRGTLAVTAVGGYGRM